MMKIGLAALAAMLAATPAFAQDVNPFSANSTTLDLRGLDLTTVEGQERLAIRMDQAASTVCGTGLSSIHLALGAQERACRADVLADIRSRISAATVAVPPAEATQLASR